MSDITPPSPRNLETFAIVVAAGRGTRLARDAEQALPKQYLPLGGVAILRRTLDALLKSDLIDGVLPVIHPDDRMLYQSVVIGLEDEARLLHPVEGGATRQASVLAGLEALQPLAPGKVLIHDGARPFVTNAIIEDAVRMLDDGAKALVAAVPVTDTLKREDEAGNVGETVAREGLWAAQTPQSFDFPMILAAHRHAAKQGRVDFTDDAAIAEWAGYDVAISPGDTANFKITTKADLAAAEGRIRMEEIAALADIRVGNGYDVHAFEPGDTVILGGIGIPHDRKLKGHSDADVVLHALADAIFGALGDGDIGSHFPPSDPQWRGAASDIFLSFAADRVRARGGLISHLDATIVCEAPKIGPYREAMRIRIAEICRIAVDRVAVKATTSEKLGFTGRKEGIATLATATIRLPL
ncbi:bifunctional 2-C-methyl-D-erythritol 4-phosphate cytidylyltransferase/2-C-methyl-D-erythritol 2,4-cyclodiphosphate synthase [Stappia sp. F7233]|uniref:Bifunctional enzyme IspD/IspF n=1 Tax=Stappia albiluteola TaxID=2758565 RepID=A0A839ACH7_9HYPH|nr:bifunctional 2-C-methyl-D-erythritol 4-phosphate cytidylyltransferase/2-C-methyl-D-erythritol 2,4-cyclodiphosphate synthase [Stappia albiluteola]MBA5776577.1 bifunctional 2-C-methyl-D-erythritol 4-phosphate cytidylyltransferase/2-C-methyl-D-erythritol 2,4-cyclodiphosphate synthase [Stappia albiluteola]